MATADQLARVRQLTDDTGAEPRLSDETLGALIDTGLTCPPPVPKPADYVPVPDLLSIAALVWEERALALDMARAVVPVADPVRVTAVRNGDVSETYGGDGKLVEGQAAVASPAAMRAVAARLRKRSCNRPTRSKTVTVLGPSQRPYTLDGDGLFPFQIINGTDIVVGNVDWAAP